MESMKDVKPLATSGVSENDFIGLKHRSLKFDTDDF